MINAILGGVIATIIWIIALYIKNRQGKEEVEETSVSDNDAPAEARTTKDIVLDSLHALQCDTKVENEDDGSIVISFEFQAHNFFINIHNDHAFVTLYNTNWYSFESEDIEQLSAVKRIVNELNWQAQANVCYNTTKDQFHVHTTASLLCCEEGDFTSYLQHILRECFVIQFNFFRQLAIASAAGKQ